MDETSDAQYDRLYGQQAWDARYSEHAGGHHHGGMWSGEANAVLVAETEGLPPGTAFDAGAGEGADALWLARRGWTVTAADISPVALDRGRDAARRDGLAVDFHHLDLTVDPAPGAYDLVTAMYLHIPIERRAQRASGLAQRLARGDRAP